MSKFKSLFTKAKINSKLFVTACITALTACAMSICACAEDASSAASSNAQIIQTAGTQLITEFTNLATALVPVIITISVTGLGIYAVIYLFKLVKQTFSRAAG